jgi:hypothetical protein
MSIRSCAFLRKGEFDLLAGQQGCAISLEGNARRGQFGFTTRTRGNSDLEAHPMLDFNHAHGTTGAGLAGILPSIVRSVPPLSRVQSDDALVEAEARRQSREWTEVLATPASRQANPLLVESGSPSAAFLKPFFNSPSCAKPSLIKSVLTGGKNQSEMEAEPVLIGDAKDSPIQSYTRVNLSESPIEIRLTESMMRAEVSAVAPKLGNDDSVLSEGAFHVDDYNAVESEEQVILRIIDARPIINAKANAALLGKGHEVVSRLGGEVRTSKL